MAIMNVKIVSIDFQRDFTAEGGCCYRRRPSVGFVKRTLVPFLEDQNLKIAEIISDYRQPRPGDRGACCIPGTWGYESEIPESVKERSVWIKCMNSPIWVRDHIGNPTRKPRLPYQDPKKFTGWTERVIGKPRDTEVALIGLTLDCCVLCAAQEFRFRGYRVLVLREAVDTYSGKKTEKTLLCKTIIKNWAEVIGWNEAKRLRYA